MSQGEINQQVTRVQTDHWPVNTLPDTHTHTPTPTTRVIPRNSASPDLHQTLTVISREVLCTLYYYTAVVLAPTTKPLGSHKLAVIKLIT